MNLIKLCFLSLLTMVLTACGGEGSGLPSQGGGDGGETVPAIVSLQVTPATATVPVGFEQQYLALATLDDGSVMDVTTDPVVHWSTSNPAVATIDNTGLATGLAPGEVIITASGTAHDVPFERTVVLTVTNAVVKALRVTPETAKVPVGLELAFTAIATFSDGSELDVTRQTALSWSSSNTAVATIDFSKGKKGHAAGVAPGTVTITASGTANETSFNATAQLEVTNVIVKALKVTPATTTVPVGLEQAFTATAILSDGSTLDVTNNTALSWTTSDKDTATIISSQVNGNGLATGVVPGTVTITASGVANDTTFSDTAQLEVTNAVVTQLDVMPETASVPAGYEQQFTAVATLSDGRKLDVTDDAALSWTTSDKDTATIISSQVNGNGLATGVVPGTVTITASGVVNNITFSDTAQLEVTNAVAIGLAVTPLNATVPVGQTLQFTATATMSDDTTLDVTQNSDLSWSSSATKKATVTTALPAGNGIATGLQYGTTTITASGINGTGLSASTELKVTVCGPLLADGKRFYCPPTAEEATAIGADFTYISVVNRIAWAQFNWSQADAYCSMIGLRLPTGDELATLYAAYPDEQAGLTYHWPTTDDSGFRFMYWSSDVTDSGSHAGLLLATGTMVSSGDDLYVNRVPSCVETLP